MVAFAATTTVRDRIIENLVTALEGISIASGYDFNIGVVTRYRRAPEQLGSLPAIVLQELNEAKEREPNAGKQCELELGLEVWTETIENDDNSFAQRVNELIKNVEAAAELDTTRGGLAADTVVIGNETYLSSESQAHGGVLLTVRISYRHALGDPTKEL